MKTGYNVVIQRPIEDFFGKIKETLQLVFGYFENNQSEGVDSVDCHDFDDIRPKSVWEPAERNTRYVQTNNPKYKPSCSYQRAHYEDVSEETHTAFTSRHFESCENSKDAWPYKGDKDPRTRLTIGAPHYIWSRRCDREDKGEEERPEPNRELTQNGLNGWDVCII